MARLKCNGYVIDDDYGPLYTKYGYSVIYPQAVRDALDSNPDGEDLVLEINSGGGSVFAGFEIYSILRNAQCNTVAEIQSLAGSAASTIACGCQSVQMSPVGQMMIHDPATATWGNIRDHRESLQALDAIKESILNGYVSRCGEKASREELGRLMSEETWLPAQECVRMGLADGVLYEDGKSYVNAYNAAQSGFRAYANSCGTLPPVDELLAREQAAAGAADDKNSDSAGEKPADKDAWMAEAFLNIEKNRFLFGGNAK